MCVGHDHSLPGIESQGHGSGLKVNVCATLVSNTASLSHQLRRGAAKHAAWRVRGQSRNMWYMGQLAVVGRYCIAALQTTNFC